MTISTLQRRLQSIYEIETEYAVSDFLISDENIRQHMGDDLNAIRETVYVSEDNEFLDITVYLHADVVEHLRVENPEERLHSGNLEDFCLATEGISHFLKLVWHGVYDRSVSLLELELQAEIDKFVLMYLFFSEQLDNVQTGELRRLLFDAVDYHSDLELHELERYQSANHYAGKYCQALERVFIQRDDARHMLKELRRFYRLPLAEKLRRINKLN